MGVMTKPIEDRIAIRGGVELAVRVWGQAHADANEGKRWIALHGYLDNAATWDELAPKLIERGVADTIVCCDMIGHGASDRRSCYHAVDFAADIVYIADALGWGRFSLLCHSLGACVGQCVSSIVPERVVRIVAVEALGFWSQQSEEFTENLRTSVTNAPKGRNLQVYASLEDAAERRSKMNMVGSLPIEAARTLVYRGTRPAPDGQGYVWASDPELLQQARVNLSEGSIRNMLGGIKSPMLLVYSRNGFFKHYTVAGLTPWTLTWCIVVTMLQAVVGTCHALLTLGGPLKKNTLSYKVAVAWAFMRRFFAARTAKLVLVRTGGHHPHLTEADDVLDAVCEWVQPVEGVEGGKAGFAEPASRNLRSRKSASREE